MGDVINAPKPNSNNPLGIRFEPWWPSYLDPGIPPTAPKPPTAPTTPSTQPPTPRISLVLIAMLAAGAYIVFGGRKN